jgi:hypothetical protein
MAPFLTHLVIGERVWSALNGSQPQPLAYGTFLFGCLAPDVDKFHLTLEQETTHFVAKDESGRHTWQRCQRFLEQPDTYLRAPFGHLTAIEQAFVLGYLCHVASDEITARFARSIMHEISAAGGVLPSSDALLTAMDPRFWALALRRAHIVSALGSAPIPESTFPFVPGGCLPTMHQIVWPQVAEGGGLEPYLRMVRRHRHWLRHSLVSDATSDASLESELAAYRTRIEADLPRSEDLVRSMDLESFVEEAVDHSLEQLGKLVHREGHT